MSFVLALALKVEPKSSLITKAHWTLPWTIKHNPRVHILFTLVYSHPCQGPQSDLFPLQFPTKFVYAFLISLACCVSFPFLYLWFGNRDTTEWSIGLTDYEVLRCVAFCPLLHFLEKRPAAARPLVEECNAMPKMETFGVGYERPHTQNLELVLPEFYQQPAELQSQ